LLFNSFAFAAFLPLVFFIYWGLGKASLKVQNLFLLVASYIFYGWWDWRFLTLIFFSSCVDYYSGLKISCSNSARQRKVFLFVSVLVNLGALGFFKYFNFFVDSFVNMLEMAGFHADPWSLRIILPVGISFYTFQTLSYTIDIYRNKIQATKDPIAFFAFVSFFPQLVAGPIERASELLPQFQRKRRFTPSSAHDGLRQIVWGFAKKMIVADNLAPHVQTIFDSYASQGSITLFLGTLFFAIQIYCDFSGYSDIAIGTARLFGFNLMRNFAFPYFSRDVGEFWRRWHISLSTWFRDYVYIPLGGSKAGMTRQVVNSLVTFTVSGLWHGANWTFVFWGFLNGLYLLPQSLRRNRVKRKNIVAEDRLLPTLQEAAQIVLTFMLTLIAWVFFRSRDISSSFGYLGRMFTAFSAPALEQQFRQPLVIICLLLLVEWIQRRSQHPMEIEHLHIVVRWTSYFALATLILLFGSFGEQEFIYFQF
jgi:alginate O-acetyltransferase complex protein AlgI